VLASLVTGAFFAFVLGRGGRPIYATVGFCLAFSSMALHRVCASMTRVSLLEHGVSGLKRRVVTLAVVVAVVAAAAVSIARAAATLPSLDPRDPRVWLSASSAWADAHPRALSWLLFPVAAMVRVTSSTTAVQFVAALPVAVAVFGIHYVWAMSTDVAFEEASAEAAKKVARRIDDMRAGRLGGIARTAPLFRLGAVGAPWIAIFWKNLIAGMRVSRQQVVAWAVVLVSCPLAFSALAGPGWRSSLGPLAIGMTVFTALLGPHMLRNDLRQDVDRMDILRSYPMRGRDIVLGELLAPLVMLSVVEWGLLAVAVALGLAGGGRAVCLVACGCAVPVPAMTACVLVLRNLGALWAPSWAGASGQSVRGIEAFGQRLLVIFGTLATLAIVMVPAGGAAAGVGFLLWPWLGLGVAPVVGLVAGGVALAEAYGGVILAGRAFEEFDAAQR
jgi:hypothetical protein